MKKTSFDQHIVESEDKNILRQDGNKAVVGYRKGRPEISGSISAVIREEMFGKEWTPSINMCEPRTPADKSVGKQLPYVPDRNNSKVGI